MRTSDKRALNSPVYFRVVWLTARGQTLHWRYFKSMHNAIGYVRNIWGGYGLHEGMLVVQWRIERVEKHPSISVIMRDVVTCMAELRKPIELSPYAYVRLTEWRAS